MSGRLAGRVVMVTGAAQGIGAAFALRLAAEGAHLCLADIRPSTEVANAIRDRGGSALDSACDVTDRGAVEAVVQKSIDVFGGVHGLVNNAAMFATLKKRPFEEFEPEEFDRVLSVNVRGPFECIRAVSPTMRKQQYGKIVNIGSGTALKGTPWLLPYVASKGAVAAMTRSIARELGRYGICINTLAPGLTTSEGLMSQDDWEEEARGTVASRCFTRHQRPEDLCGTLVHLLSAESDFMTGQTIVVDGGSVMN